MPHIRDLASCPLGWHLAFSSLPLTSWSLVVWSRGLIRFKFNYFVCVCLFTSLYLNAFLLIQTPPPHGLGGPRGLARPPSSLTFPLLSLLIPLAFFYFFFDQGPDSTHTFFPAEKDLPFALGLTPQLLRESTSDVLLTRSNLPTNSSHSIRPFSSAALSQLPFSIYLYDFLIVSIFTFLNKL